MFNEACEHLGQTGHWAKTERPHSGKIFKVNGGFASMLICVIIDFENTRTSKYKSLWLQNRFWSNTEIFSSEIKGNL